MPRNKIKTLRNRADKLYQELGREMYKNCFCGKTYSCLHHHQPKSRSSALRYDIKNGIPICQGCHFAHHNGDPDIAFKYKIFMEDKWGENWETELRQKRYASDIKTNEQWYKANIEMLEEMIKATNDNTQTYVKEN